MRILWRLIRIVIRGIFLSAVLLAVILFYAVKIEPYLLKTESLTLGTDLAGGLKMVQISDIQISRSFTAGHLEKTVEKINGQNPDLVLFTGDLYENYADFHDDEALIRVLSRIRAPYGKYAVWGNRDRGGGAARRYEDILRQSGFQILCNEGISVALESGETLFLAGLDDALLGDPDAEPVMEMFQAGEYGFSILMTHEPDTADLYADAGFDLILSGHSHGGQVKIPFLPGITTAMAEKYVDGLYRLNDRTSLYVNTGIGTSRFPARFGVVPEITVFNLEKEEQACIF